MISQIYVTDLVTYVDFHYQEAYNVCHRLGYTKGVTRLWFTNLLSSRITIDEAHFSEQETPEAM